MRALRRFFSRLISWATAARDEKRLSLRGASRVTGGAGSLPRRVLVVLQIALSLALLSVPGLLISALHALETQDFGFKQDRRVVARINPKLAGYQPSQLSQLYRRIHDAIANTPGVSSVALCLYSPPGGGWGSSVWVDGRPAPGLRDDNSRQWDRVTPGYFEVIGTPIVEGRGISEEDTAASRRVAVVNEAFARKFFGNENPIGRHFGRNPETSREFEVVGLAKDARYLANQIDRPVGPLFFCQRRRPIYTKSAGSLFLHDIVISAKPGVNLSAPEARHAMASVDPGMPIIAI